MRIVIADDAVLLREGLARVLDENGHEVVAQVGRPGRPATMRSTRCEPDLVIVDVRMPPTFTDEGTQAAIALRAEHPELRILVLSQIVEARHALSALPRDAGGLRLPPQGPGRRARRLPRRREPRRARRDGDRPRGRRTAARRAGREDDPLAELTPREREVLGLIAEGRSNKAICAKLFLSPKTIETHVNSIFLKLGLLPRRTTTAACSPCSPTCAGRSA